MHKITVNELILKKGYDQYIKDFYNTEYRFFLALLYAQSPEARIQIARIDSNENLDRSDYVVHLDQANTRICHNKSFQAQLESTSSAMFSLLLVKGKQPTLSAQQLRSWWEGQTLSDWLVSSNLPNTTKIIEINFSSTLLAYNSSFTLENDIVKLQLSIKN